MKSDLDRGVSKEGGASIGGGLLLENLGYVTCYSEQDNLLFSETESLAEFLEFLITHITHEGI